MNIECPDVVSAFRFRAVVSVSLIPGFIFDTEHLLSQFPGDG